jgi:proteasome lid subunit RPN8/RPN11
MQMSVSVALLMLLSAAFSASPQLRFTRLAENALAYLYNTRTVEFAVCLYGPANPEVVSVERVAFTFVSSYSSDSVTAEDCPADKDLLGMAHSHPDGDCRFSGADVAAFLARSDHPFDFVVCENNQINWIGREEAAALSPSARTSLPPPHAARLEVRTLREVKVLGVTSKLQ